MKYDWVDRATYPFKSNYYNVNGFNMHYVDEGDGEVVLFVHGTPSWSFDFRHLIQSLRNSFRCIAIDHIGFGLSDKPENYDHSTLNHSLSLEKFILDKKLRNITLVVHDFGGPIGLNFAIKYPDLINKIVILNSWLWSSESYVKFQRTKKILKSPFLPFLYKYFNFSPRFILPASFGTRKISKKVLKQFTLPFSGKKERNGTIAFANSLLNDQSWFEKLWNEKSVISNKPVLFIWGMKDPVVGPEYLEKFEKGFENTKTIKLPDTGHFPQEESPDLFIDQLSVFLTI